MGRAAKIKAQKSKTAKKKKKKDKRHEIPAHAFGRPEVGREQEAYSVLCAFSSETCWRVECSGMDNISRE